MQTRETSRLRQLGPIQPARRPEPTPPRQPEDRAEVHASKGFWRPVAGAVLLGVCLLGGAGMVQAQTAPATQEAPTLTEQLAGEQESEITLAQQLDEASLKQGIGLEFRVAAEKGETRQVDAWTAERILAESQPVTITEVTRADGPVRGNPEDVREIRREVTLNDARDLDSYVRYFTGATPQNATESAAQRLKKYVLESPSVTLLTTPEAPTSDATLSPFAAARRLAQSDAVVVRSLDESMLTDHEVVLTNLFQVGSFIDGPGCNIFHDPQGYHPSHPVWCLY